LGEPSDRQLLARFAECRDHDAFAVLVRRHGPMVLAVCRRLLGDVTDAEDAFQATFVVLARKAGARGWQESIGGWLYEVAYRCASKIRAASARHRCQAQVPDMPNRETTSDVERHELRAALDDELSRLPEKYRAPLVLCYLQGKSNEEAARLLGCPVGTVYGRLARARDLLRDRLARRCLMTPVAMLLGEEVAPAAVPVALLDTTIQAATLPGEPGGPVAKLVEGVLHTMYLRKLKMAAVVLLTVGLMGAGAGIYHHQRGQGNVTAAASPAPLPETETWAAEDGLVALAPTPNDAPVTVKQAQPKASEPIEKDGLQVTVKPAKAVFALQEPLVITLTFENVSKKDFTFLHHPLGDQRFRATGVEPVIPWEARWWSDIAILGRPPLCTLAAGQRLEIRSTLDGKKGEGVMGYIFYRAGQGPRRAADSDKYLPAGKYLLTVDLFFQAALQGEVPVGKPPLWVGQLTTKPVEFEVAAQAAGQQDK